MLSFSYLKLAFQLICYINFVWIFMRSADYLQMMIAFYETS